MVAGVGWASSGRIDYQLGGGLMNWLIGVFGDYDFEKGIRKAEDSLGGARVRPTKKELVLGSFGARGWVIWFCRRS